MNKTPTAPNPLPPVFADERPGLILGVSGLMMSWSSWPRELRFSDGPIADGSRWQPPVSQMDGYDCTGIFLWVSRLFPDDGHLSFTLTLVVPPCLRHRRDIADRDSQ
jgi:hypothetical protein